MILQSDIVSINLVILLLEIIGQCGIKYTIMLPIKIITSDLKVSIHINISITACQIGLALILAIISVSIFTPADLHTCRYSILYIYEENKLQIINQLKCAPGL